MVLPVLSVLLLLPILALSHPTPNPEGAEWDYVKRSLPSEWYQPQGHPVEKLFTRQAGVPTDGVNYPAVGSAQWSQGYPGVPPDSSKMPQEWINALNTAVNAGKIPNIPQSNYNGGGLSYPQGVNPGDPASICSASFGCRAPGDIWDAPDGVLGLSFDDGPTLGSDLLYNFLENNSIPSTHFMIGSNILLNPALFTRAFQELHSDIAVHTWSHRYMTTLSNLDVVAEFGWTMQIIKNSTGGRLPRYWRPPYGDTDNRVRAIAKEVFGLQTIIWNHDTLDWSLTTGGTNPQAVSAALTGWLNGPKSPGLLILEHELTTAASQSFIDAYPLMVQTGWKITSVAQMEGQGAYVNSKDGVSPVQPVQGVLGSQYRTVPSSSSSIPSSTSTPPPAPSNTTSSNTSQSDKNGSTQSIVSKFAGILGAIGLTVAFYAW